MGNNLDWIDVRKGVRKLALDWDGCIGAIHTALSTEVTKKFNLPLGDFDAERLIKTWGMHELKGSLFLSKDGREVKGADIRKHILSAFSDVAFMGNMPYRPKALEGVRKIAQVCYRYNVAIVLSSATNSDEINTVRVAQAEALFNELKVKANIGVTCVDIVNSGEKPHLAEFDFVVDDHLAVIEDNGNAMNFIVAACHNGTRDNWDGYDNLINRRRLFLYCEDLVEVGNELERFCTRWL